MDSSFNSQNRAHWPRYVAFPYRRTANKLKPISARPFDVAFNDSDFAELQCPCGAGPCIILTSKTEKNPGRKFFTCPLNRGEGDCNFFQWQDTKGKTIIDGHKPGSKQLISPRSMLKKRAYIDLVDDGGLSFKHSKRVEFESLMINDHRHPPLKRNKVLLIESKECGEQSDVSCPKHYDPLEDDGSSENDTSIPNSTSGNMVMLQAKSRASMIEKALKASLLTSQDEIHHQQTQLWRLISTAGATSSKDPIYQILDLHVQGWLGKLAFPPPLHLRDPPTVFSSVDPIFVPQDVDVFDIEGSTTITRDSSVFESDKSSRLSLLAPPLQDAHQLPNGVLWEISDLKSPPNMVQGNTITGSILEAFGQAAIRVQSDLLALLESMDPLDHESMVREANSAFVALNCLSVDYKPFFERVREFIGCASSLAGIEWSISNDFTSQELLLDQYNCAKDRFDELSRNHAEAMAAFTASDERLQLLREEASHVKNMLIQIENQLSSCQAETMEIETRIVVISEEMLESKQCLQAASQEAGEVWKLQQQRELERRTAKAALEKARVGLRQ